MESSSTSPTVYGSTRAVSTPVGRLRSPLSGELSWSSLAWFLASATAYAVVARLSLFFVLEPFDVAAMWPPAGLAIGLLLISPPARWAAILAGVAAGVAAANATAGVAPGMVFGFVFANTLEPLFAALMLRRSGFTSLSTLRGVGVFIGWAVVASPMLAGLVGASSASAATDALWGATYVTWVAGNAGGVLAVAPIVLTARPAALLSAPVRGRDFIHGTALGGALVVISFGSFVGAPFGLQLSAYPAFVLLVVAAMRFGIGGAAVSTFVVSLIATAGTMAGRGPIAHLNPMPVVQVAQVQVLIGVAFLVTFVTAAALAERRQAASELEARRRAEAERAATSGRITAYARTIARSLEPDALFREIATAAGAVLPADTVLLTIVEDGAEPVRHRVVAAVGAPGLIGRQIGIGEGVIGKVVADGNLHVRDRATAEASDARHLLADPSLVVASAPITSESSVSGTLTLARKGTDAAFSADDVHALELMAELAAIALRNATAFARAQDLSIRDELTGLPNRRYFTSAFEQLTAQRQRQADEARLPVSAVLFDLDHFGSVNKERGHATGDRVLAEFGRLLASRLRRADVVARYGGEEFVAVLVGTERDDAVRVADEIRQLFAGTDLQGADGQALHCTVSAGVATAPADQASLESLLSTADVALSMAKRAGRNMVSAA